MSRIRIMTKTLFAPQLSTRCGIKMSEKAVEYKEESQALELIESVKTVCITSQEKYDEVGRLKVAIKEGREKQFQLWEALRKSAGRV